MDTRNGALENDSPPASNRGANFTTAAHLDWISCNFGRQEPTFPDDIPNDFKPCKPFLSYDIAYENSLGLKILSHSTRPEMGHYVQCSGDVLATYQGDEYSLLSHFALRAKMKRIDVCLDVWDSNLNLTRIRRQIRAGKAITRAQKFPTRGDAKLPNDTVYAGTKQGDIYTKIYDKAVETKQPALNWKRIETTYQGDRVQGATKAYLSGAGAIGLIRGHIDFPAYDEWVKVMAEEPQKIRATVSKVDHTWEWFMKQVAPAMKKYIQLHGDAVWNEFRDAVWADIKTSDTFDN